MDAEPYFIEKIMEQLSEINTKLDKIVTYLQNNNNDRLMDDDDAPIFDNLDAITLLALPDHLRTTALNLYSLGIADAEEISKNTGKERAVESNYLNQLERMGYVEKIRKGRKVYFKIK
jgi:DNA-binding transcriptional ArsR family regulator